MSCIYAISDHQRGLIHVQSKHFSEFGDGPGLWSTLETEGSYIVLEKENQPMLEVCLVSGAGVQTGDEPWGLSPEPCLPASAFDSMSLSLSPSALLLSALVGVALSQALMFVMV